MGQGVGLLLVTKGNMFFSSLRLYVDPFVGLLIYFSVTVCVNIFLQLFYVNISLQLFV